ncbi:MAG TPA: 2-oxoacid:acceptor oxidoreductase family protein [Woeseiaceae bacterium]|jgi:2-oxoacid:acceptor oxidoreductase gamma subunit (pyruvate/2-ketoisovalerate family)|nr:2-oxoacid:acceptor oxidoreductase family protein [Woeseiaceae bacterium]
MIEIRIHGRGGQGGVTLAKLIATSRFLEGQSVQAFGLYAAERSGAPIQAFCRYANDPITNRNLIYEPDHVIVLDPTLVGAPIVAGLRAGGWILINSPEPPASFVEQFPRNRLATVDATTIARDSALGTRSVPIVNTALAGAVARMLAIPLKEMLAALEHLGFVGLNIVAARRAYQEVALIDSARETDLREERVSPAPDGRGASLLDGGGGAPPTLKTGHWATEQPHRQQMVPPCNHICPAGNNVQGFLNALANEKTDEALAILLRTTPFPSVCGRACPAPCMDSCNRIELDGAVNVRQLERYAGDHGQVTVEPEASREERVAIVGSGPAGLTAAYHLARFGYRVRIFESGPDVGGLLVTGIPEFRLPEDVVAREIGRVLALGVTVETGRRIDRPALLDLARDHDAVLVATGLQEHRDLRLGLHGAEAVTQGIDFLDRVHDGRVRVDGEEVVVIGGGNTAMDAARSALRLGAERVRVVYRRTRDEMPAIAEEIDEALEEGVAIDVLTQPVALREDRTDGAKRHYRLTCRRMQLGGPDESGRRAPVEIPGSDFDVACHRVILALGQSPDVSVFPEGTEVREGNQLLGLLETPVFAVGDLATREGTIAAAIGSGRRSAVHIHSVLSGEQVRITQHAEALHDVDAWRDEVISADAMKLHLFERQPSAEGESLSVGERLSTFDEVHMGLDDAAEARRCLSCGVCNECDLCCTYCPEGILKRVGHRLEFDYSYCKGCGVCVAECPRNVIFMSHL